MKNLKLTKTILVLGLLIFGSFSSSAQPSIYVPSESNLKARKEFADSKFGIFLHWGLYSMFGQGEWYLEEGRLNAAEYAKSAGAFYPAHFNAKEWVSTFKDAGIKYICFTSRHHDGFSMFDSKYTDYDIIDASPFKRDIVKELADECHAQGLKFHLYYSHIDWSREDYYPLGNTGRYNGRKHHGKWEDYYHFMNNQLTELLTNYGEVNAIWFDGMWDHPEPFDWRLEEQYRLIHSIQPACLIGNNHHKKPKEGEDFQLFERDLPGENKAGFSGESEIGHLPLETCETMNGMWGYKIKDQNYKSVKTLIHLLVQAAGKGANLLLNVGPQPDGQLPILAVERLKGMGKWLKQYGESIYGTTQGCVIKADWGTTTSKDNITYVHILSDNMPQFITLPTNKKLKKAVCFDTNAKIMFESIKGGVVLHTAGLKPSVDCILTLTFAE